jgi:hypothetical protein
MLKKLVIPDIQFDFATEHEYTKARITGCIPDYNMARITRVHVDGDSIDYPCHSREGFINSINRWIKDDDVISFEAYQSVHYYDIQEYY